MLTPVERVLILKTADLLSDVGPRHLLGLAEVAREVEIAKGDRIYKEEDAADAVVRSFERRVTRLVAKECARQFQRFVTDTVEVKAVPSSKKKTKKQPRKG